VRLRPGGNLGRNQLEREVEVPARRWRRRLEAKRLLRRSDRITDRSAHLPKPVLTTMRRRNPLRMRGLGKANPIILRHSDLLAKSRPRVSEAAAVPSAGHAVND